MDILKFIEKTHPLKFILFFLFVVSVTLNVLQFRTNRELIQQLNNATQPIIIIRPPAENIQPRVGPLDDQLFTSN